VTDTDVLAGELRLAVHRLTRRLRQENPPDDLTLSQISALAVVFREGPLTAGDLAAAEQVRPPSMTRMIAALETSGMVARTANPLDARQVMVSITDLGRTTMETYIRLREQWLHEQLAGMSGEELDCLHRACQLLDRLSGR
jgi:DNA-binding MarR family transcriptional regulator